YEAMARYNLIYALHFGYYDAESYLRQLPQENGGVIVLEQWNLDHFEASNQAADNFFFQNHSESSNALRVNIPEQGIFIIEPTIPTCFRDTNNDTNESCRQSLLENYLNSNVFLNSEHGRRYQALELESRV
ncbi:MAG TPA: hypothetical protein VJ201_06025, partial [Candidatus Babeliales bacterium]|nr:hypothetical protein [Candidatus Babeliales bacterium]